jgi:hypothetical protein
MKPLNEIHQINLGLKYSASPERISQLGIVRAKVRKSRISEYSQRNVKYREAEALEPLIRVKDLQTTL